MNEILQALGAPFQEHKTRKGGGGRELTYISIDQMLTRANEVLGLAWSTELISMHDNEDRTVISLNLHVNTADGKVTRIGVGGSDMADPDDRVKTALAEALKKALNQFGMGLYLWDDEQREEATKKPPTLADKKAKLVAHFSANNPQVPVTREVVAEWYGTSDFDDEEVVDGLLADAGLVA
jgi:hypothetical protein